MKEELTNRPKIEYVERPWGSFKQFANNQNCTVSLMTVRPGERLSLQSHSRRSELWIVIDDEALIQVGEEIKKYKAGNEIWIPVNEKHRLSCKGDQPVRVLEVAFGKWEQKDIERYSDDYERK